MNFANRFWSVVINPSSNDFENLNRFNSYLIPLFWWYNHKKVYNTPNVYAIKPYYYFIYRETLTDHPLGEQPIVPERTSWLLQYSMMKLRFAHVFWGQCTHNEYLALLLSLLCVSVELCCWKDWYRKSSCLPLWYFQLFWYFNFLSLIRFWLHWITGFHTNHNKSNVLSIQTFLHFIVTYRL